LRFLGALATVLTLVVGFGLWRLTQGPISLDPLTPFVQRLIDRAIADPHISISAVSFGLGGGAGELDLRLAGVRLSRPDGQTLAAFPAVATSFSLRSLLRGSLTPARLVVEHPVLLLTREEDGHVDFRFGGDNAGSPDSIHGFVERLAAWTGSDASTDRPHRLVIRDATILVDDRRSGRRWQFDRVDATASRNGDGIAGDLAFAIGANKAEVHSSYRYSAADQSVDARVEFGALEPSALVAMAPELSPLEAFRLPVRGTVTARLDLAAGAAEGMRIDLGLGKGVIKSPRLAQGRLDVEQGELHAVYAPEANEIRLVRFSLDLGGGAAITVKGRLQHAGPALSGHSGPPLPGELQVSLANLPVAKFESLWPETLSSGGRRWVLANVADGVLEEAAWRFGLAVDPATGAAELASAGGSLRYRGLTIRYLADLPPVREVDGTAKFTGKALVFSPHTGEVAGVRVTGGTVQIVDLGEKVEWLAIDLGIAGPLRGVLETLDSGHLRYARAIGLDPATAAGRVEGGLHFKLPLLHDLRFDQVSYGAKGALQGVALPNVAMGRGIENGEFALELTRNGLRLQGRADFDAIPTKLDARLDFKSKAGPHARYRASLTLDDAQRRRLIGGFFDGRVSGPVGVDLDYRGFSGGRAEAAARLDLRGAALSIAEAGWRKAPGATATASLTADLKDERITALRQLDLRAPGLDSRLRVAMTPGSERIDRITVDRLQIGANDLAGSIARLPEGGWRIDLSGSRLDLRPWLELPGKDNALPSGPLLIDARLGRLILGPQRELRDVGAQLRRDGDHWQAARIDARFPNGHSLALRFGEDPGRGFKFESDDFGASLSLADVTDNIVGGRIAVTGRVLDQPGGRVTQGHIEAENYNLTHAPVFARILSLASLPAIASMLSGSGIPFSTLRGDFVHTEDRLAFENLIAYGGAIGATANGAIDTGNDRLDLQGTIVPAYTLNTILGNIPVLGPLLLGGEGQGLFGVNYRLTGSSADPQIAVNPLSALAPGFLRRLFQPDFGVSPPVSEQIGQR
jgi:hypothetical protein